MRWLKDRPRVPECLPTRYACHERKQVSLFTNRRCRPNPQPGGRKQAGGFHLNGEI